MNNKFCNRFYESRLSPESKIQNRKAAPRTKMAGVLGNRLRVRGGWGCDSGTADGKSSPDRIFIEWIRRPGMKHFVQGLRELGLCRGQKYCVCVSDGGGET